MAITSTGEAFTTNTGTGMVLHASPDHDVLEPFLPPNSVIRANVIAVSPDDKLLFVAGWIGVARVEIATRQVQLLAKPLNIADANMDDFCFYKDSLIGIQKSRRSSRQGCALLPKSGLETALNAPKSSKLTVRYLMSPLLALWLATFSTSPPSRKLTNEEKTALCRHSMGYTISTLSN